MATGTLSQVLSIPALAMILQMAGAGDRRCRAARRAHRGLPAGDGCPFKICLVEAGFDNAVLHESLHEYSHPNWQEMVRQMNWTTAEMDKEGNRTGDGLTYDEGMTELLTAETFPECVSSTQHPTYTAYQNKTQEFVEEIGLDTRKQAYFGGNTAPVLEAWRERPYVLRKEALHTYLTYF